MIKMIGKASMSGNYILFPDITIHYIINFLLHSKHLSYL